MAYDFQNSSISGLLERLLSDQAAGRRKAALVRTLRAARSPLGAAYAAACWADGGDFGLRLGELLGAHAQEARRRLKEALWAALGVAESDREADALVGLLERLDAACGHGKMGGPEEGQTRA